MANDCDGSAECMDTCAVGSYKSAGADMREMVSSVQVTKPCKSSLVYLDIPAPISLHVNEWACFNLSYTAPVCRIGL